MNAYQLWKITANPIDPEKRVRIRSFLRANHGKRHCSLPSSYTDRREQKRLTKRMNVNIITNFNRANREKAQIRRTSDPILQRAKHFVNVPKRMRTASQYYTARELQMASHIHGIGNDTITVYGCSKEFWKPNTHVKHYIRSQERTDTILLKNGRKDCVDINLNLNRRRPLSPREPKLSVRNSLTFQSKAVGSALEYSNDDCTDSSTGTETDEIPSPHSLLKQKKHYFERQFKNNQIFLPLPMEKRVEDRTTFLRVIGTPC